MDKKELYGKLLFEMDRSLSIDEKSRRYWTDNHQNLPLSAVRMFCDRLADENARIDKLVAAGTDADPALAGSIINKSKEFNRKFMHFYEAESRVEENPEQYLNQNA